MCVCVCVCGVSVCVEWVEWVECVCVCVDCVWCVCVWSECVCVWSVCVCVEWVCVWEVIPCWTVQSRSLSSDKPQTEQNLTTKCVHAIKLTRHSKEGLHVYIQYIVTCSLSYLRRRGRSRWCDDTVLTKTVIPTQLNYAAATEYSQITFQCSVHVTSNKINIICIHRATSHTHTHPTSPHTPHHYPTHTPPPPHPTSPHLLRQYRTCNLRPHELLTECFWYCGKKKKKLSP